MTTADIGRRGIRCMLMRGGTSKGAYFLSDDLPADSEPRDDLLLRIMGSPDPRQIDGLGGAHPLTSKVAIVSRSTSPEIDIDYLFLQIGVDDPVVADAQTCGNLLAGIGPFAIERGLIEATGRAASVRIRLLNTGDIATATFSMSEGMPTYDGDTTIAGVPGTAGRISLEISGGEKPLLPSGHVVDEIAGHHVTMIDNGMPVVLLRADDFGLSGAESPDDLESRADLQRSLEQVRITAGRRMNLGDVEGQTVPKMVLLSPPQNGGAISTRAFIPTRVHTSIGVLMAASVAAGIRIPGAIGHDIAELGTGITAVEHPSGMFPAQVHVEHTADGTWTASSQSVRTARKIFDGTVFPRPRQ